MTVTIFDPITGQILRIVQAPSGIAQNQAQSGEAWMVGKSNDLTQYVSGGLITDRPEMPGTLNKTTIVADGADEMIFSGLPDPCDVAVSGPVIGASPITGGTFVLTVDFPGDYRVEFSAFPYLPKEISFVATA